MKKLLTCFFLLTCLNLNAQLLNPQVEQGVPGWDSIGTGTGIRCFGDTVPSPAYTTGYVSGINIYPQYGFHFMELYSGGTVNISALENFANVPPTTIDTINPFYSTFPGSPSVSTFGSAVRQIVPVIQGQVLRFNYMYGTNDAPQFWGCDHSSEYIDYSYFTVSASDTILVFILSSNANLIGVCPYYLMSYGCDVTYTNANPYCTFGPTNFFICPEWQVFTLPPFAQNDTVTISFGVVNVGDNTGTSRLLLDNFLLNAPPVLNDVNHLGFANQANLIGSIAINGQTTDVDDDSICSFIIQSLPVNGILIIENGISDTLTVADLGSSWNASYLDSLFYVPNTNFTGIDSFDMQVADCNSFNSNVATVFLDIGFAGLEHEGELQVELYPNPTTGMVFFKTPQAMDEIKVEVMDSKGKLVMVKYSNAQLDISNIEAGLYFLRLSQGVGLKIIKVVKLN